MTDTPEGMVLATFAGAAPRHFPGLGLSVEPGESYLIPERIAAEMDDVCHVANKAAKTTPTPTEGEG